MNQVSSGQRALWTFLITTLAAPFLAALIVMLLSVVAGVLGKGPESLRALNSTGQLAWAAEKAVSTFAWSALPAAAGGLLVAAVLFLRGRAGWIEAVAIGAAVAAAGAFVTGGIVQQHLAPVVAIGALVAFLMWSMLTRAGILPR